MKEAKRPILMTAAERSILIDVLVYHQRSAGSGCVCGWHTLGASYAWHVVDVYEQALVYERTA